MLLRLYIDNFMSFSEETELNSFPNKNLENHQNHVYNYSGVDILKMLTIYGANASGKSNLIKALSYLQSLVINEKIPEVSYKETFALSSNHVNRPFKIAVEFISEGSGFIYGIEIDKNEILCEELYESGLGTTDDKLIFRKSIEDKKVRIKFFDSFYESDKNKILLDVLEESLLKKHKPVFKFLTSLKGTNFEKVNKALYWFENTLQIIKPKESIYGLAYHLFKDSNLYDFANNIMSAYHVGIDKLILERYTAEEFFGKEDLSIISNLKNVIRNSKEEFFDFLDGTCGFEENGVLSIIQIKIKHYCQNDDGVDYFNINEESDGTKRLLDFIPAFYISLKEPAVFCIDEIGQSIHPMLIRELLNKFSADENTVGQMIFTTHESNILDQDIFRRDEIWFTEKQKYGSTKLYSLNSFKEHNTKNIRKGYLNGRYGAVPFLGNLKDLNWLNNDTI